MEPQSHQESTTPLEKKTENRSFKDLVYNFTQYTTAHGISRLAASQTIFWKIFWSLVCIGASGMFIYQARGLFKQYLSKPVTTSVSVAFQKKILFPAVTVCNSNMIRRDRMPTKVRDRLETQLGYYNLSRTKNSGAKRRRRNSPTARTFSTNTGNTKNHITSEYPSIRHTGDADTPTTKYDYDDLYDSDEYNKYRYDGDYYDHYGEGVDEEEQDQDTVSFEKELEYELSVYITDEDIYDRVESGHQFEDFISHCVWKGIDCKDNSYLEFTRCCFTENLSKFWTRRWDYKYGNCFTFNNGEEEDGTPLPVLKATKPGPAQGLLLRINVEQEQYIGPLTDQAGVRVLLHGQGSMIFPFEEGFSVSPGISTSVGIKKTLISRLDRFKNKSCLLEDQLSATNIYRRYHNVTTYTQQACLNSCLGLSQRIRCKCAEAAYPTDRPLCNLFDDETRKCVNFVNYLFKNDKLKCLADCRQPCKEEIIHKTISSSEWPSKAYKEYITLKQGRWGIEGDNLLELIIFFNEMNYESIEQRFSYGTINLLADIGGQLGLWIGLSVITVFELMELILMFFTVCAEKMKAGREVNVVTVSTP